MIDTCITHWCGWAGTSIGHRLRRRWERRIIPRKSAWGLHADDGGAALSEDLSYELALAHWLENPYWQHFCGERYFQHRLPIDASSMTRWCGRLDEAGPEPAAAGSSGIFRSIFAWPVGRRNAVPAHPGTRLSAHAMRSEMSRYRCHSLGSICSIRPAGRKGRAEHQRQRKRKNVRYDTSGSGIWPQTGLQVRLRIRGELRNRTATD
jgi:hypothetical protein